MPPQKVKYLHISEKIGIFCILIYPRPLSNDVLYEYNQCVSFFFSYQHDYNQVVANSFIYAIIAHSFRWFLSKSFKTPYCNTMRYNTPS